MASTRLPWLGPQVPLGMRLGATWLPPAFGPSKIGELQSFSLSSRPEWEYGDRVRKGLRLICAPHQVGLLELPPQASPKGNSPLPAPPSRCSTSTGSPDHGVY